MTRPKLVVINSDQSEQSRGSRDGRKYRFELSRKRLVFYVFSMVFSLCFMFVLGILAGRGIALVSAEDYSFRAEFMRFLGLGKPTGQPGQNAAESWGDPRKMLESLNYYEDLTQKGGGNPAAPAPPMPVVEPYRPAADPTKEPVRNAKRNTPPAQPQPASATPEKASAPEPDKTAKAAPPPVNVQGEQYTLLVASLKDPENAQRMVDQLKGKGYAPRIEALDLNGGGRWSRVLVGTFQTRDAAIKFAADFNKKENMEGLVIREPN